MQMIFNITIYPQIQAQVQLQEGIIPITIEKNQVSEYQKVNLVNHQFLDRHRGRLALDAQLGGLILPAEFTINLAVNLRVKSIRAQL